MNKKIVVLSSLRSDSHMWALTYLQLWLEEHGFRPHNLGNCVPTDELIDACRRLEAQLVVISSVNGHAAIEGREVIEAFRQAGMLGRVRVVIGGKLATSAHHELEVKSEFIRAGYSGVFIGSAAIAEFAQFLEEEALLEGRIPVISPASA